MPRESNNEWDYSYTKHVLFWCGDLQSLTALCSEDITHNKFTDGPTLQELDVLSPIVSYAVRPRAEVYH